VQTDKFLDFKFKGRINKPVDTCYAFWVGGILQMLGCESIIEQESVLEFLSSTEHKDGGFGKYEDSANPDPIHTLHALFGLSLIKYKGIKEIDSFMNVSKDVRKKIENLKNK